MLITDMVTLVGDRRTTQDGYLVAAARISRTGIQTYSGAEMGRTDLAAVRVWRPEEEVFAADALASMAHRPVTLDHPAEAVTSANWKALSVGQVGGEVARDGDYVRVPLVLMDRAAIDAVTAGKRQLSVGYTAEIDWTAGTTPAGEPYDAVQRRIRANHLAVVDAARAGPACRIGDAWNVVPPAAPAATPADEVAALRTALEAKDGEIAALTARLRDAELTPARLDEAVAARARLVAEARRIGGEALAVDTLGEAGIRRAAVAARIGDAAAREMSDAAVEGAFRVLAAATPAGRPDPLRQALATRPVPGDARGEALRRRDTRLTQAWRTTTSTGSTAA
ncbi:DUF2213 domain-containing protein [Inquilinus limosus]|uniref:DUF2213 domain-containing protein n=1 Tax=Inquilinus limosus TaxID=171674 RepID=A0A211ZU38_9PROT|nr:DUF2213 domain-containing protein [Inquilinus limosus]OWJ68714.1 hypothetical protein BWR60_02900 [Inquilinus limosus]